jgi:Transposase
MHYERTPCFRRLKLTIGAAADKGWLTSFSRKMDLKNGTFTSGERYALARMTFPSEEATHMSRDVKYIGTDVHKEAIVIAVRNTSGKVVMESIVETEASNILQFIHGLRGELHVTWEEGTWAAWLYDLLKPQVHEIPVRNPRRNALLKEGSKNDKVDARKLSELLHAGMLRPVYHGENGLRTLRELARTYQTLSKDLNRVMNRIKSLYRGWGIACAGTQVYAPRYREEWLQKIEHAGVRRRAELLYEQLDGLQALRRKVRPGFGQRHL